jgi:hypothetical protein
VGENPKLYRDARTYVRVEASRRGGFGGPIEVIPVDLPPGVEAGPVAISAEQTSGLLELRARTNAQLGTFPFKVEARAYLADKMQVRRPRITIPGETASAYLTLLPEAPFQISLLTPTVIMEQKQGADLMAEVRRTAAATQKIQLTLDGWSNERDQAVKGIEGGSLTINAGETRGTMKLKANLDSNSGDRLMYLRGETSIDGKSYTVYGPAFPMVVREFPFTLSSSLPKIGVTVPVSAAQSAAAEAEFTIKATRRGLFTDDIALAIEGLPEGITISSTNLSRGTTEVAYKLLTTPKAQAGKTNTLTVVGTANVNGRQFVHRDTKITLVISAPSVEVATNQTAKAKP